MKTLAMAFVVLISLLLVRPANADPATAKQHFDQASAAYKAGRYREAAELFSRAYEVDRHPEILFNIARSYEKAGDDPKALENYRRYLQRVPESTDRALVEQRIEEIVQRIEAPRLQRLKVLSTPGGARVVLDGVEVGKTPWSGELETGKHTIVLERPGFLPATREVTVTRGRPVALDVTLEEPSLTPASGSAPPPPETLGLGAGSGTSSVTRMPYADAIELEEEPAVRPLTWVAFGVGVAALGGAVGFELARRSAEEDADAALTQVEHRERYETMEDRQLASRILAGVGAAAMVTGGVLLIVDLSRDRKPERVGFGFGCQQGACGVAARGRLP